MSLFLSLTSQTTRGAQIHAHRSRHPPRGIWQPERSARRGPTRAARRPSGSTDARASATTSRAYYCSSSELPGSSWPPSPQLAGAGATAVRSSLLPAARRLRSRCLLPIDSPHHSSLLRVPSRLCSPHRSCSARRHPTAPLFLLRRRRVRRHAPSAPPRLWRAAGRVQRAAPGRNRTRAITACNAAPGKPACRHKSHRRPSPVPGVPRAAARPAMPAPLGEPRQLARCWRRVARQRRTRRRRQQLGAGRAHAPPVERSRGGARGGGR